MFSTKAILLLALGAVAQAVSATIEPRSGNGMVQAFTDTACKNKKAGSGAVEIGNLPDAKSCIGISDYKSYYAAANPPTCVPTRWSNTDCTGESEKLAQGACNKGEFKSLSFVCSS